MSYLEAELLGDVKLEAGALGVEPAGQQKQALAAGDLYQGEAHVTGPRSAFGFRVLGGVLDFEAFSAQQLGRRVESWIVKTWKASHGAGDVDAFHARASVRARPDGVARR